MANLEPSRVWHEAMSAVEQSEFEVALKALDQLLEQPTTYVTLAEIEVNIGKCYYYLGDNAAAARHLSVALDAVDPVNDEFTYLHILDYLGRVCLFQGEHRSGMQYLEDAERLYELYDVADDWCNRFEFRLTKGRLYQHLGEYDSALLQFEQARQVVKEVHWTSEVQSLLNYEVGCTHHLMCRWDLASECLSEVAPAAMEHYGLTTDYHRISMRAAYENKDYQSMLNHFEELRDEEVVSEKAAEDFNFGGRAYYYLSKGREAVACFNDSQKHATAAASVPSWIEASNLAHLAELKKAGFE